MEFKVDSLMPHEENRKLPKENRFLSLAEYGVKINLKILSQIRSFIGSIRKTQRRLRLEKRAQED